MSYLQSLFQGVVSIRVYCKFAVNIELLDFKVMKQSRRSTSTGKSLRYEVIRIMKYVNIYDNILILRLLLNYRISFAYVYFRRLSYVCIHFCLISGRVRVYYKKYLTFYRYNLCFHITKTVIYIRSLMYCLDSVNIFQ